MEQSVIDIFLSVVLTASTLHSKSTSPEFQHVSPEATRRSRWTPDGAGASQLAAVRSRIEEDLYDQWCADEPVRRRAPFARPAAGQG